LETCIFLWNSSCFFYFIYQCMFVDGEISSVSVLGQPYRFYSLPKVKAHLVVFYCLYKWQPNEDSFTIEVECVEGWEIF
jgi:hypothetical protein